LIHRDSVQLSTGSDALAPTLQFGNARLILRRWIASAIFPQLSVHDRLKNGIPANSGDPVLNRSQLANPGEAQT
jgi:hypothetical protein